MPAVSPAELEARLRLHLLPDLGPRRLHTLLRAFPDAASALSAPASAWRSLGCRPAVPNRGAVPKSVNGPAPPCSGWSSPTITC
ncbi:Smf protein, DNA processing chain A [Pseudomonas sp. BAY1663]|nr:Smf protein, DNA processing chain A [Pseudomonas sp. BAY1663]